MPSVHEIRLAGPWELIVGDQPPTRTQLPINPNSSAQRSVGSDSCLVARRKFHAPSGLSESTRLELQIADARSVVEVRLNDKRLDSSAQHAESTSSHTYELPGQLPGFNELAVKLNTNESHGTTLGHVILRIVEP